MFYWLKRPYYWYHRKYGYESVSLRIHLHRFRNEIRDVYWSIRGFISNTWKYRGWLAHDADFDFGHLLRIMEIKLRNMARHFQDHRTVTDSDRIALECLEAAKIINEMCDGKMDMLHGEFGYGRYKWMSESEQMEMWEKVREREEQNRKRLGELVSGIECWWD